MNGSPLLFLAFNQTKQNKKKTIQGTKNKGKILDKIKLSTKPHHIRKKMLRNKIVDLKLHKTFSKQRK